MGTSLFAPSTWQGRLAPVTDVVGPTEGPNAPRSAAPAAASPPLTAGSFPTSGFSNPNAFNYLMQVLGLGGMPTPGNAPGMQPQQPQGGGFAALIQQMLSQFGGQGPSQSFTPGTPDTGGKMYAGGPGMIKLQPGTIDGAMGPTPGPSPNPLSILNQYGGPLGNGGGYLNPRMTIQPIRNPIQYGR